MKMAAKNGYANKSPPLARLFQVVSQHSGKCYLAIVGIIVLILAGLMFSLLLSYFSKMLPGSGYNDTALYTFNFFKRANFSGLEKDAFSAEQRQLIDGAPVLMKIQHRRIDAETYLYVYYGCYIEPSISVSWPLKRLFTLELLRVANDTVIRSWMTESKSIRSCVDPVTYPHKLASQRYSMNGRLDMFDEEGRVTFRMKVSR